MASSSSATVSSLPLPSPVRPKKYDVFISFRGEDTRNTFTCHLNHALRRRNIETYVDDRLDRGDVISEALMKAIKDSCASLIIFSENYAFSKWCLDELTKIMECKKLEAQIIIPVFYRIDPSHVRKQSGSYMTAFEKHEGDFAVDKEKVFKWKAALTEAANLAGYNSQSYRTDYELIEDIVKSVLQKLKHMNPSELRGLVGVERYCALIEPSLRNHSNDVRIIGIWGISGIGKTTLAAILFATWAFQFEGRCFLENVGTKLEKHGLSYLRNILLSETLEEKNIHISSRLKFRKALIVLDDINTSEQLECLVGECNWLGLGSRIIVTTKNNHVVSRGFDEIYEIKELNFEDSLKLFSLNAFNKPNPEMQYEELSVRAVLRVGGIPLALKILSAFLRSKEKTQWDNALRELQEDGKIQNVVRLSYDDLHFQDKDIFLGIACFLKGREINNVRKLLDKFLGDWGFNPNIGIRNLIDKALITISNSNTVEMHDLIEEIGWKIVRQDSRRWWDSEKVFRFLKYNMETDAVEGIILDASQFRDLHLPRNFFKEMRRVTFLKIIMSFREDRGKVYLPSGLTTFPNELRYLHWSRYPLKSLPSTFSAEKLVEFSMPDSRLEKLWEGVLNLPNLKEIVLNGSKRLVELPDLSTALNLKSIYLIGCTSLRYMHPSILSLPRLKRLHLNQCTLNSLRSNASSNSSKYLPAIGSSSLLELFPMPKQMRRLYFGLTGELPPSTSPLDMLDYFTFRVTEDFNKLDTILDSLWYIKELDLSGCTLYELPENINKLIFLHYLELKGSRLVRLPANIKHLSWLRFLGIRNCRLLNSLPELPPLIHLDARGCISLETVFCSIREPPSVLCKSAASYLFENCIGLGQPALHPIMEDAYVRIKLTAYDLLEEEGSLADEEDADDGKISVCIPGNKCPNWFSYCSEQPSFSVELPAPSKILGFAFCVILPASESENKYNVGCERSFEADDGETVNLESWFLNYHLMSVGESKLDSDHIYLWYDARGSAFIMDKFVYSSVNIKQFSFRFFTVLGYNKGMEMSTCEVSNEKRVDMKEVMIRFCGVQPIYAPIDPITIEDGKEFHNLDPLPKRTRLSDPSTTFTQELEEE